jgi:UDP-N-acetylmuramoyl-L-alanyl-D-glutamate--2,6-diaminopimelate ligase
MTEYPKTLKELVNELPGVLIGTIPEIAVTGITFDSRQVVPGNVFVALAGMSVDGHQFIPHAVQRGAILIIGTQPYQGLSVPYLQVQDSRRALAKVSAAYYSYPASKLTVIGVTGTDGKTTTSNMIYHILQAASIKTGMVTTVNALIGDKILDTGFHVTTPEAPDVQRYLHMMVTEGITHVVLEATSHGLNQQRLANCDFDLAVVTNITHEHLDYHGSYKAYQASKGLLFSALIKTPRKERGNYRIAVLNRDDRSYEYLESVLTPDMPSIRMISYGLNPEASIRAEHVETSSRGVKFITVGEKYQFDVMTHLIGDHNLSNCLAAIATTVEGLGISPQAAQQGIRELKGIPGRMEIIDLGQDFTAIVDFAHTPNALSKALHSARGLTQGKVIAIFGSAGLRDQAKRKMMAEISTQLAEITILTAEDPRLENLDTILAEMTEGAQMGGGVEGRTFWRIRDRGEAIQFGISLAQPGDVVIACGKGHEQSMCFDEIEYPWDDRIAMRAVLSAQLGIDGPKVPYLPTQDD